MTLVVNHKSKAIPADMWRVITPRSVDCAVQIMQDFQIMGEDGSVQRGNAGDYIVQTRSGAHVIVAQGVYEALFKELA